MNRHSQTDSNGLLTAEIMNWTGHVLSAPRSSLVEVLKRPEAARTGIYLLVGSDPENAAQALVYVGESDNVGDRLTQHNRDDSTNFWEITCIITNKDTNLTKAHVRYLESRVIGLVKQIGRARLLNSTTPEYDYLPESDKSDMEYIISQLQTLLPVLGFEFLKTTPRPRVDELSQVGVADQAALNQQRRVFGQDRPTAVGAQSPVFELSDYHENVSAKAIEIEGQMVILAGSEAREQELPSLASNVKLLRHQLRQSGKLVSSDKADVLEFVEDVAFSSPRAKTQKSHC